MVHSEELQERERGSDKTCHKWRARPTCSCEKQASVRDVRGGSGAEER